jgi:AraC-like DNA-binding protein
MGTPQSALAGLTIAVESVSRPLSRALEEARDRARSAEAAVAAVQRCLEGFVDRTRLDPRVHHAVDAIHAARGEVSIERLAHDVSTTRRHLERLFAAAVGLSPKRLARIARFQHALQWLERIESAPRGAETAATCGYADQAHFIRDFRYLAGCAPGAHLRNRAEMTAFFVEKDGDRTGQSHLSASSGGTRAARRAGT